MAAYITREKDRRSTTYFTFVLFGEKRFTVKVLGVASPPVPP
jgi:hypothetical protein